MSDLLIELGGGQIGGSTVTAPETSKLEKINELFERSKDDRAIIVGSEIRFLCATARRGVEAEQSPFYERWLAEQAVHMAQRQRAETAEAALAEANKEILDTTWEDHADYWQKRAVKAEAALAEANAKLLETCKENIALLNDAQLRRGDVAEAVRREREACQSECQKVSNLIGATSSDEEHAQGFKDGAESCVNAIRARNEPAASPAAPIGEK